MIGNHDPYYTRSEVSNSDLTGLMKYFMPPARVYDIEQAYRFGNLIDAMITEPDRCNHYLHMVDDVEFSDAEWETAKRMLNAFREDEYCMKLLAISEGQKISSRHMEFEYEGIRFSLPVRCKWDLWIQMMRSGADIKSTTATSVKQFRQALEYFNYDQQRAFYMDIENTDRDMLIGISKVNFQIFKVPILRGDKLYESGRQKYLRAAFRYWTLFSNFN